MQDFGGGEYCSEYEAPFGLSESEYTNAPVIPFGPIVQGELVTQNQLHAPRRGCDPQRCQCLPGQNANPAPPCLQCRGNKATYDIPCNCPAAQAQKQGFLGGCPAEAGINFACPNPRPINDDAPYTGYTSSSRYGDPNYAIVEQVAWDERPPEFQRVAFPTAIKLRQPPAGALRNESFSAGPRQCNCVSDLARLGWNLLVLIVFTFWVVMAIATGVRIGVLAATTPYAGGHGGHEGHDGGKHYMAL